jgi:[ribosomal protein S5]-alanine N-acetyltransferase
MSFHLQPIGVPDLQSIATSRAPTDAALPVAEGALPPPHIASRSLEQLAQGKPAYWCSTFFIVRTADRQVVGACGYKDAPAAGRVEIGYGVAPSCQRQGAATAAVGELLRLAFAIDAVHEVLAQVNPANLASTRVVRKFGFDQGNLVVDDDGELLVQWLARRPGTGLVEP